MFETGGKLLQSEWPYMYMYEMEAIRSCQNDVKKLSKTFLGSNGEVHSTVKLK